MARLACPFQTRVPFVDGKRSEMTEGNERSGTVASQQYNRLNTGGLFERGRAPLVHFYQRPTGSADGKRMILGAFPEAQIDGFFQKVDSSKTMSARF